MESGEEAEETLSWVVGGGIGVEEPLENGYTSRDVRNMRESQFREVEGLREGVRNSEEKVKKS